MSELPQALTDKLKLHFKSKGYSDISINTEAGSVKGDNYLGVITKSTINAIDEDGQTDTYHWIVKSAPENEQFRQIVCVENIFQREMYMYETVFKEYKKLQEDYNIQNRFDAFTTLHLVENSIPECLVMEDMKQLGYVMKSRYLPLDYNHTMLVMKEYGKLHALTFALKAKKPELYEEIAANMKENFFAAMQTDMMVENARLRNDKVLTALVEGEDDEAIKRFKIYLELGQNKIKDSLQPEAAGEYGVFGHGDSWVNNMLFKYKDDNHAGSPTQLCLLDFQLSRIGSPALDLSYFIFTCTDKELRDAHYDEMLKTYHNSMSELLKEFSCDVEEFFPFSVLLDHMKNFSLYGLMMTSMVTHLMLSDSDEIPDFTTIDLNDLDKFVYESKNELVYRARMRAVINDFVDKEYL